MHAARKAFVENEASDKLRRALQSKTRTLTPLIYEIGDKVFYKRKNSDKWLGPARVLGSENKQVFVKHGGEYYRVSPVHLQLANQSEIGSVKQHDENRSDTEPTAVKPTATTSKDAYESDSSDEESIPCDNQQETGNDTASDISLDGIHVPLEEESVGVQEGREETAAERNPTIRDGTMPFKGSKTTYKRPESDSWESATVIGRSGTARGKNKWWSNIRSENDTLSSLNMEELDAWNYVDEETLLARDDSRKPFTVSAMQVGSGI